MVRRHLRPAPSLDLSGARTRVIMSGWGEAGARGDWYANQDFSLKSLTVQNGEKLPSAWQVPQNARYLQETYGKDCIVYKSPMKAAPRVQTDENVRLDDGEWISTDQYSAGKKQKKK